MTQPAMDVVETTKTLTSVLLKVMGWIFIALGAFLALIAVGSLLVALDVRGSAEWFAEHSTECGPTGGSSFETCSDTGRNPEVSEVKGVFWFLCALFTAMAIAFVGGGWLTIWLGGRARRLRLGLEGPGGPSSSGPPPPGRRVSAPPPAPGRPVQDPPASPAPLAHEPPPTGPVSPP